MLLAILATFWASQAVLHRLDRVLTPLLAPLEQRLVRARPAPPPRPAELPPVPDAPMLPALGGGRLLMLAQRHPDVMLGKRAQMPPGGPRP
jgi:hypothetical protein